jgi:diaminopimelate decarboxylase
MDHFTYRGGVLHAEEVPLTEVAAAVGTPAYVYSAATLTRHYRVFQEALAGMEHLICYAVKANSNLAVLALMARLGAGMDVVSEGEYRRARASQASGSCSRGWARPAPRCGWRSRAASGSSTSRASRS